MKKISLFIVYFIFCCLLNNVKAQTPKIDSLENILQLHIEKDTVKVNLLNECAWEARKTDREKILRYAEEALELAGLLNFEKGKASSLFRLGYYYYQNSDYQKSLDYYQKSLDIYEVIGKRNGIASCLSYIGLVYLIQGNYPLALEYLQKSLEINKEAGRKEYVIENLTFIGQVYLNQGNYPLALEYLQKALEINTRYGRIGQMSSILSKIALLYLNQGNYPLALEYLQKALKISEENGNKLTKINCLINIGVLYDEQNNYTLALAYYQKALKISDENYYSVQKAHCLNNIGEVYSKQANYKLALSYYQKALKISEKNGSNYVMAPAMNNIGTIYYHQANFTLALDYLQKALKISKETSANETITISYANLGLFYLGTLNYKKALDYTKKSLIIAREHEYLNEQKRIHLQLSDIYTATKDYKKALENYILYKELSDSVFNEKNIKKITGLEYQYEFEKEKQAIELEQQKKDAITAEKLKRQKTARNFILLFAILLMLLVYLIYRNYKNKQEANKMKLRFFTNISHELRTPLTLLISPLERMSVKFKENDEDNLVPMMLRNTRKLKNLTNQLLDISKIETQSLTLVKGLYEINNVFKTITSMFVSMAQDKNIDFRVSTVDQDFVFSFDKERIEHVISNLLSNAFKFTPKGGQVKASVSKLDNQLCLSVKDTGIGISKEEIGKVFNRFYQSSTSKNESLEGTGIGLNIVKEYVNLHDGTVSVKSELGKGSEFLVKLPLYGLNNELIIQSETKTIVHTSEKATDNKEKVKDKKDCETLLIVEDNKDLRNYLKSIFHGKYSVLEASNGEVGKQVASKENPDIIISDVMMPICDGYCLTEYLKSQIETSHIPIILLTAKASQEDKLAGYEQGADDYIAKPFDEKELVLKVHNVLMTRKKQKDKYSKIIIANPSEIVATSIDEQLLQQIVQVIEQNISNIDFSIDQLCTEVGLSRRNIFRKLKALADMSPSQFIRTFRLKRAAQLLSQKAGSVSEIAYKTGFDNLSYFTKCFKEAYQKLPSEYLQ